MKIKGMDKDMKCRDFQFELGKEYKTKAEHISESDLCTDRVFHYCDSLQKVHNFYPVNGINRFFEIEVLGEEVSDNVKCGSNHIKIVREIKGVELVIMCGKANGNTGLFNSGGWNSGNGNSGDFNSCNYSSGVFCNQQENIRIFNKPTDMTHEEFFASKYCGALYSVPLKLTEWIEDETETEGGYLKVHNYKEACANWWAKMSEENKEIIKSMPNFDAEIFKDITGIEV